MKVGFPNATDRKQLKTYSQIDWRLANFAYIAGTELFLNRHDGVRLNGENSPVLQYIWAAVNPAQTCNNG